MRSRVTVFFDADDFRAYPGWLEEAAERYQCALHAYVLMTNHIHLLATPQDKQGIGRMMQYLGRRYVPCINHRYDSSGSIWEGRYKASLIDNEHCLLTCMRYIELNPVRASMTQTPAHSRWSSYRRNAQGKTDAFITPHPEYLRPGKSRESCLAAYKALFKRHIDEDELKDIPNAWQTGTPLGSDYFKEKIERKLKSKVGQDRRGRPKRALIP